MRRAARTSRQTLLDVLSTTTSPSAIPVAKPAGTAEGRRRGREDRAPDAETPSSMRHIDGLGKQKRLTRRLELDKGNSSVARHPRTKDFGPNWEMVDTF